MTIYLFTYGRPHKQKTFGRFPKSIQQQTYFVVRPNEEVEMVRRWGSRCAGVITHPQPGIANARQTALEHSPTDKVLMFDDDLKFDRRLPNWDYETNNRALLATQKDMIVAIQWLKDKLNTYAVASLGGRPGNNQRKNRWEDINYRVMRSFGVRRSILEKVGVRFDDFYYWEDFHVALTLLEQGYPNVVNQDIVTDGFTNTRGGVVRNAKKMWAQARRFARLHAPFVKVRNKEFVWGPDEFIGPDLTVKWKRAFGSKVGVCPQESSTTDPSALS